MTHFRFHKLICMIKVQCTGVKHTRYSHLIEDKNTIYNKTKNYPLYIVSLCTARIPCFASLLSNSLVKGNQNGKLFLMERLVIFFRIPCSFLFCQLHDTNNTSTDIFSSFLKAVSVFSHETPDVAFRSATPTS